MVGSTGAAGGVGSMQEAAQQMHKMQQAQEKMTKIISLESRIKTETDPGKRLMLEMELHLLKGPRSLETKPATVNTSSLKLPVVPQDTLKQGN